MLAALLQSVAGSGSRCLSSPPSSPASLNSPPLPPFLALSAFSCTICCSSTCCCCCSFAFSCLFAPCCSCPSSSPPTVCCDLWKSSWRGATDSLAAAGGRRPGGPIPDPVMPPLADVVAPRAELGGWEESAEEGADCWPERRAREAPLPVAPLAAALRMRECVPGWGYTP